MSDSVCRYTNCRGCGVCTETA